MGQDFLTLSNVGNFTFQLFAVVVATEFTKKFIEQICEIRKKENKTETEFIVFIYSLSLSLIKTLSDENVECTNVRDFIINSILVIVNAAIISYFATASYSKIIGNHKDNEKSKSGSN